MASKLQKLKWDLHQKKHKMLLLWGLNNGYAAPYSEELIKKLRNVYYGGIPASVILLSNGMSNGHCYDRALLMSRAFLDEEDVDVNLLYASIDSLKLNPKFMRDDPMYADHCIVEVIGNGRKYIFDTSCGFVFDKRLYWLMEKPKVRHVNGKEKIKKFIEEDEDRFPEDVERDKYVAPLVLPMIELTYGRPTEMYSMDGIGMLQREIEHYKQVINYDAVRQEIDDDLKNIGLRKKQVK